MNHVKKFGILAFLALASFAVAQTTEEETPDATLNINHGSFALGIGVSRGSGTLTCKGKEYPVSVSGLSLGKVGFSKVAARGNVYNLKSLKDFDGNYTSAGGGMTLAGGGPAGGWKKQT